jgi:hypothetical protein
MGVTAGLESGSIIGAALTRWWRGRKRPAELGPALRPHFAGNAVLPSVSFRLDRSATEFLSRQDEASARQAQLAALKQQLTGRSHLVLSGTCRACGRPTRFRLDRLYSGNEEPNWRERLQCEHCSLNQRLRLCANLFDALNPYGKRCRAYIAEQVTPAYGLLAPRCRLVGSEYLGPDVAAGCTVDGVRHEDGTALSFASASFDVVMSFDVLEHIPDFVCALRELHRVLRRGGSLLLSAPFNLGAERNLQRATIDRDGRITHLEAPEFHGDPLRPDSGVLCYWHFGWELLGQLRALGFRDAAAFSAWSPMAGYLGPPMPVLLARK